jgi:hypothetical protein
MNSTFTISFIELIISIVVGVFTVYLTKLVMTKLYLKKTNELNPYKNTSYMIFLSGTIFSVSYIVFGIMEPFSATVKLLSAQNHEALGLVFDIAKYLGMFLSLGYLFGGMIIFLAYKLFSSFTTQVDEYEEIYKNNIGVAILLSVLTIVIALFTKSPFIVFIETLIPFPDVPGLV